MFQYFSTRDFFHDLSLSPNGPSATRRARWNELRNAHPSAPPGVLDARVAMSQQYANASVVLLGRIQQRVICSMETTGFAGVERVRVQNRQAEALTRTRKHRAIRRVPSRNCRLRA